MEKYFLISTAVMDPKEAESAKAYSSQAMKLLSEKGGTVVGRYPIAKTLSGEYKPSAVLVAEFPSESGITDFLGSPEYAALVPLRDKGFSAVTFHISKQ